MKYILGSAETYFETGHILKYCNLCMNFAAVENWERKAAWKQVWSSLTWSGCYMIPTINSAFSPLGLAVVGHYKALNFNVKLIEKHK